MAISQNSSKASGGKGKGRPDNPGGGGGHTETAGNNLSFPVIFPEGVSPLTLRGDMNSVELTDPYFVPGEYDSNYWFHQKSEGNQWQAYNEQATEPVTIDKVDIGDALESARIALGRFVRIELALFKDVGVETDPDDGWLAYKMEQIDGQGKREVQGTPYTEASLIIPDPDNLTTIEDLEGLTTYRSDLATVYAPNATSGPNKVMNLTIQKFDADPVTGLEWNGEQWVGPGIGARNYAANTGFGSELTVSGKVISGVSGKPFKFTDEGNYRITFEIEEGATILLDETTERYNVAGARQMEIVPDGEMSYDPDGIGADTHNGLIYLDVQVPSTVAGDDEVLTSQFFNFITANESSF